MTWKHIRECLPHIKNLNKTNNLDRMDEMTYPTLSEVMDAVKKRDADLLAIKEEVGEVANFVERHTEILQGMSKAIKALQKKLADIESPKQFEKIMG